MRRGAVTREGEIRARRQAITPGHWVAGVEIEPEDGRYWELETVIAVDELPVPDYVATGDDERDEAECRRIEAWEEAHSAGTVCETHNYLSIPAEQHVANQRFIAHAPEDVDWLLSELDVRQGAIEVGESELAEAREALSRIAGRGCRNFMAPSSCRSAGRRRLGPYSAERWCPECLATDVLERTGQPHLRCTYHGQCPQPDVCASGCRGPLGAEVGP